MLLNTPDIEIFDKVPIRYKLFIDDHSYDIIKHTCLVPLQAKNPKMRINPPKADKGTE